MSHVRLEHLTFDLDTSLSTQSLMPPRRQADEDGVYVFFKQSDRILRESQFIVDSLPNVEMFSLERAIRLLYAICNVLEDLQDPRLTADQILAYRNRAINLAQPLVAFQNQPPPPRNIGTSVLPSEGRGRPRYDLDLVRAIELHDLGSSWESIADALGVTRQTLYNHLRAAGLPTHRPVFTEISDNDLDQIIAEISLAHPLSGSTIILGHLESRHIHIPVLRVQESLQRVDPVGVLLRYAQFFSLVGLTSNSNRTADGLAS